MTIIAEPSQSYGKDAYYFSHDSNARNDHKCLKLRRVLGMEGYGIFWVLVEMLRDAADYKLPMSVIPDIAYETRVSDEKILAVINQFDLFEVEDEHFFSLRLIRTMQLVESKRLKLSEAGKRGRMKQLEQISGHPQATPGQVKESKGKEIKVNESKGENNTLKFLGIDESVKKLLNDSLWVDSIRHLSKGKNLEGAARSAFAYIQSDEERFKRADLSDLKKTTLSWLSNDKGNGLSKESAHERMKRIQ